MNTYFSNQIETIKYVDYIEKAKELALQLRQRGAQIIVAVTHSRMPFDDELASKVDELDLILAGHDHSYSHRTINGITIINSGCDFRYLSYLKVFLKPKELQHERPRTWIINEQIPITHDIIIDQTIQKYIDSVQIKVVKAMDKVIGHSSCDLDARFETIRTQETNAGNLFADVMRWAYEADMAIGTAGTVRIDSIIEAGLLKKKHICSMFPFKETLCVVRVTGKKIWFAFDFDFGQNC